MARPQTGSQWHTTSQAIKNSTTKTRCVGYRKPQHIAECRLRCQSQFDCDRRSSIQLMRGVLFSLPIPYSKTPLRPKLWARLMLIIFRSAFTVQHISNSAEKEHLSIYRVSDKSPQFLRYDEPPRGPPPAHAQPPRAFELHR